MNYFQNRCIFCIITNIKILTSYPMKILNLMYVFAFLLFVSCSSSDDDEAVADGNEDNTTPKTVFERLQNNTYKQIEKPGDCLFCEDEINYYSFSTQSLIINGTTLNGTCEDYEINAIGDCEGCAVIVEDTVDKLVVTPSGAPVNQTITFLSETQIQIEFPVPIFGATWTADLYTGDVPDCE